MGTREQRTFTVTTAAGTLISAPLVTALTMPARIVRTIQVVVPPGPNGQLGFAFGAAGQRVIPFNAGGWIVTSDEKLSWDIDAQIESGAWQLFTYNTGVFPHTLYVRFLVDLVADNAAPIAPPSIPNDALSSITAADLAALGGSSTPLADLPPMPDAPDVGALASGFTP